jgi:hypothetical protein
MEILMIVVVKKETPKRPEEYIPTGTQHGDILWDLLTQCWSNNPRDRPTAAAVSDQVC